MEYKITIEKLTPREGAYPSAETIYVQVLNEEDIDIERIIRAVNLID